MVESYLYFCITIHDEYFKDININSMSVTERENKGLCNIFCCYEKNLNIETDFIIFLCKLKGRNI